MLRRQGVRLLRKPLIVMSPKSLLRHKEAISTIEELAEGHFHNVLDETDDLDKSKIERIVLCSGKIYYDLRAARRERGIENIAILRMEQLYPFPEAELLEILHHYPKVNDTVWCQATGIQRSVEHCGVVIKEITSFLQFSKVRVYVPNYWWLQLQCAL